MSLGYSFRLDELMSLAKQNPNLIDLSMCDPPRFGFRPDPNLTQLHHITQMDQGYPLASHGLIEGIRERTRHFTGVNVDDSPVVITNGCGGALAVLSIALMNWSIGIETPFYSPAYEYFKRTGTMWFAECRPELDWGFDFDLLRKELEQRDGRGAIFVVSPSNPTGHVHEDSDWRALVNLAGEFDQVLVTDEVYDEMSYVRFKSLLRFSDDIPIIYMHGFSKVWRAPEIRVGYIILHDPSDRAAESFEEIRRVASLGFGVNPLSQQLALHLLNETPDFRMKQFEAIKHRRDVLNKAINDSSNLHSVEADGATYQMVATPWNDWQTCSKLLNEHNMLVTPGSVYAPSIGDKFVRVVFLNTPEALTNLVLALDNLNL